jgi:hypothetical protein
MDSVLRQNRELLKIYIDDIDSATPEWTLGGLSAYKTNDGRYILIEQKTFKLMGSPLPEENFQNVKTRLGI